MVTTSMEEPFSTKMVQGNKVEETTLMYLGALKDDNIVTGNTFVLQPVHYFEALAHVSEPSSGPEPNLCSAAE